MQWNHNAVMLYLVGICNPVEEDLRTDQAYFKKSIMVTKQPGINCLCCRLCPCLNFHVLKTRPGIYKLIQVFLAAAIQSLLLKYGHKQIGTIGFSYDICLTTSSACFFTPMALLITYLSAAKKSIKYLRASLFELLFNALACILYMICGGYLAVSMLLFLCQMDFALLFFLYSPALSTCYVMCFLASSIHGVDALSLYIVYKRKRHYMKPRNAV